MLKVDYIGNRYHCAWQLVDSVDCERHTMAMGGRS